MTTLARPAEPTMSEHKEEVSEETGKTSGFRSGLRAGTTYRPGNNKPDDGGPGSGPHQPYP